MNNDKIIPMARKENDLSKRFRADLAKEYNIVGQKIGEARKNAGMTQAAFAQALASYGVSIKTPGVNKWEKGETIPNAYQLMAVCHALGIEGGLDYFTGPVSRHQEVLNSEGLRMLNSYRQFLESKPRYLNNYEVETVTMPVSLYPASAGFGDYLDGEAFEDMEFPASSVPEDADFAVPVDGDSM